MSAQAARATGSALRRSTTRRIARLDQLMAAFASTDMGHAEAAALLRCSLSSARSYMFELIDAGVLVPTEFKLSGRVSRPVYRLNPDARVLAHYQSVLASALHSAHSVPGWALPGERASVPGVCAAPGAPGSQLARSSCVAAQVTIKRDPLVAALFGARHAGNGGS